MTPKRKFAPVTEVEIKRYLAENSDFQFEMSIAQMLSTSEFSIEHSGSYEDPITKKTRQFDIRATKSWHKRPNPKFHVHLAVECKNISEFHPIVVHSVSRADNESFCEIVYVPVDEDLMQTGSLLKSPRFLEAPYADRARRISNFESAHYVAGGIVGKSMDQISIDINGKISVSDSDVFEKMSQAINSSYELIENAGAYPRDPDQHFHIILPILVIPEDRLWNVNYNRDGTSCSGPKKILRSQFFLDRVWSVGTKQNRLHYRISHLEICTPNGLRDLIDTYFSDPLSNQSLFCSVVSLMEKVGELNK